MAPAYKLTYFPVKALGEPIRFLLAYGGLEFEDSRIDGEDFLKIKPSLPFGQMPLLELNGKSASQSLAICRYLAKQVKLVGKTDWEDLEIDSVIDSITDLRIQIQAYHYEKDSAIKELRKGPLYDTTLPFFLERLDAIAKKNNGHMALGRLTWADIYLGALFDSIDYMTGKDLAADYPNLKAVKDKVLALPNIKAWVNKRPDSDS